MRLEVEGRPPLSNPTSDEVRRALLDLRNYGPSSFASLTDDQGSYLQVGGGGVGCVLERRDLPARRHHRAYQDAPNKAFPDGTLLVFGGGQIAMRANEWFTARLVADVFVAFLEGRAPPDSVRWRDITDTFPELSGPSRT